MTIVPAIFEITRTPKIACLTDAIELNVALPASYAILTRAEEVSRYFNMSLNVIFLNRLMQ